MGKGTSPPPPSRAHADCNVCRILKLGKAARTIFPQTHTLQASSGDVFYTVGFLVALILWAFALVWLFFALASIVRCKSFPFNIGWWGFTFPLGVFATCTCEMGTELPSEFFRILGTVCSRFRFLSIGFSLTSGRLCRFVWLYYGLL